MQTISREQRSHLETSLLFPLDHSSPESPWPATWHTWYLLLLLVTEIHTGSFSLFWKRRKSYHRVTSLWAKDSIKSCQLPYEVVAAGVLIFGNDLREDKPFAQSPQLLNGKARMTGVEAPPCPAILCRVLSVSEKCCCMPQFLCITPKGMAAPWPWHVPELLGSWLREGGLGEGREMSCLSFSASGDVDSSSPAYRFLCPWHYGICSVLSPLGTFLGNSSPHPHSFLPSNSVQGHSAHLLGWLGTLLLKPSRGFSQTAGRHERVSTACYPQPELPVWHHQPHMAIELEMRPGWNGGVLCQVHRISQP